MGTDETPAGLIATDEGLAPRAGFGPGLLVTAAFIGPGTVVTASRAGADYGCELLWTILFACGAAIVLQSMAARLGIVTGAGIGEAIRDARLASPWRFALISLVIAAIGIGNAAYQTGNFSGAVAGIASVAGGDASFWVGGLACFAAALIWFGRYKWLHRVLVTLVVLLSVAFLFAASQSLPSADRLLRGALVPRLTEDRMMLVIGLIGTTIVPYNLFMHASTAATAWQRIATAKALAQARLDTLISISLGGLVTMAIVVTASSAFHDSGTPWTSIAQIGDQLRPTLGDASGFAFAMGLFAAGLTSSITAPMATAFAVCGCMGWSSDPKSTAFRGVAMVVIAAGSFFAIALGGSPASVIVMAQVANGLLLPIVAFLLLWLAGKGNRRPSPDHAKPKDRVSFGWLAGLACTLVISAMGVWRIVIALWPSINGR